MAGRRARQRGIQGGVETFSAVVTTGIYCRPGCSARPRPDHVTRFQLAAAAEAAGYRACLRCRPYRSAPLAPWTGPELVCRAVRLVLDGALDKGTEAELGARLGVSARHLRRLSTTHLGVTPDGLARSARTHFARRLLDDTDLSMLEIAFAAGFGSLRQFNRACQDVFKASPRELRARRRIPDRLVADGGLWLRLPFHGRLDWGAMLAYFAARAVPGVEHVAGDTYRRTVVIGSDPGVLELMPGGEDHLILRAHLPHWEELIHVVERARRIASLDVDFDEPARRLGADPTIVERFGLTHTFPSPDVLAGADLDGLGLTLTRANAIRLFARAVAEDAVRLDRSLSLDQLISAITALDGLGSWTAHYIALRLGEPDACPTSDLALQRALSRHTPRAGAALGELAERWRPWRALAATHLWIADGSQQAPVARSNAARGAA